MATLKGENLRILTFDATAGKWKVLGMSTSCSVTLNTNADDSGTKDDVGMAAKPTVNSKSWQVSVDTLNVVDAAAMLTAIKNLTPFTLLWDETSTTNNQTALKAAFARKGSAFLSDLTLTFNDRENAAKSLQFTGSGELAKVTQDTITTEEIASGDYSKGQFTRLFLGSDNSAVPAAVIAGARQLSLHVSRSLENSSTKDTVGDWDIQEPTALNFDITTSALIRSGETITSQVPGKTLAELEDIYEASLPVKFQIANVSGDNQRTKGTVLISGSVIIATLTQNGPNKKNADYTANLTGYGIYSVGAA